MYEIFKSQIVDCTRNLCSYRIHSPSDSASRTLDTLQERDSPNSNLITTFGCLLLSDAGRTLGGRLGLMQLTAVVLQVQTPCISASISNLRVLRAPYQYYYSTPVPYRGPLVGPDTVQGRHLVVICKAQDLDVRSDMCWFRASQKISLAYGDSQRLDIESVIAPRGTYAGYASYQGHLCHCARTPPADELTTYSCPSRSFLPSIARDIRGVFDWCEFFLGGLRERTKVRVGLILGRA